MVRLQQRVFPIRVDVVLSARINTHKRRTSDGDRETNDATAGCICAPASYLGRRRIGMKEQSRSGGNSSAFQDSYIAIGNSFFRCNYCCLDRPRLPMVTDGAKGRDDGRHGGATVCMPYPLAQLTRHGVVCLDADLAMADQSNRRPSVVTIACALSHASLRSRISSISRLINKAKDNEFSRRQ